MSRFWSLLLVLLVIPIVSCSNGPFAGDGEPTVPTDPPAPGLSVATFAGGCFWCMQKPFDQVEGVTKTVVGYTGGSSTGPRYQDVAAGRTDHVEAIEVTFDPEVVSFERLLDTFWRNIDPTQTDGQFADRGAQYRTAIFVHSDTQRQAAEASKRKLGDSGKFDRPIYTKIFPAALFWRAEEYHQEYYKKNPREYARYHRGSGRAGFIERVWGP